jgi:hypothetical protein
VMHGDAHPGNVYFRDGEAGLLDWQAVPPRASRPRTGLHTDHQHDHRQPSGLRTRPTRSPSTAKPWRPEAAPSWIPTSSGYAIDKARCTRTWHR